MKQTTNKNMKMKYMEQNGFILKLLYEMKEARFTGINIMYVMIFTGNLYIS